MEQRGETGLFVQLQKPPDEPPEVIHPSYSGTHTPDSRIAITNIKSCGLDCAMTLQGPLGRRLPTSLPPPTWKWEQSFSSRSRALTASWLRMAGGCRLGLGAWAAL